MNLSAENMGRIRDLVEVGFPLSATDIQDLHGHNEHLTQLLEARFRLMLGIEIERDQLKAENAGFKTGYEAYEAQNAALRGEIEALRKDAERYRWLRQDDVEQYQISTKCSEEKMDAAIDAAMGQGEKS